QEFAGAVIGPGLARIAAGRAAAPAFADLLAQLVQPVAQRALAAGQFGGADPLLVAALAELAALLSILTVLAALRPALARLLSRLALTRLLALLSARLAALAGLGLAA